MRERRVRRVRARIFGTAERPRLAVARSNQFIYAQLIDDAAGRTLAHASSRGLGGKKTKSAYAQEVGTLIAKRALELGITKAVFDRRQYKYHGRVKALREGARSTGLGF